MRTDLHQPIDISLLPRLHRSSSLNRQRSLLSARCIRLAPGLYWEPAQEAERWQHRHTLSLARAQAAQLSLTSPTFLTHASAALHLGLAMHSQEPDVYLAVRSNPKRVCTPLPVVRIPLHGDPYLSDRLGMDRRIVLWRRHVEVGANELTVVDGLPMTHALRTAFDCAFDEPAHNALAIADSALRLICQPQRQRPSACAPALAETHALWEQLLAQHPHRRGIAQARAILQAASPMAESPLESVFRWFVLQLGLTPPILQHPFDTRAGSAWVDLCWPQQRVIIEVDGRVKYDNRDRIWKDKLRQDAIEELGWSVIRVTAPDLRDLPALRSRILSVFPPSAVSCLRPRQALLWPNREPQESLSSSSLLSRPRPR